MPDTQTSHESAKPAGPEHWTIMLYITADGTLTNFAVESLKQLNKSINTLAESGSTNVKVAAHFSFPGGTTIPGAAGAGAPANQIKHEYIFPHPQNAPAPHPGKALAQPGSRPSHFDRIAPLPPRVELSVSADKKKVVLAGESDKTPDAKVSMTDDAKLSVKEALKAFLNAVYKHSDLNQSQHFALILWGHGPELLLRPPAVNPTGDDERLYLTPEELREVLTECKPPNSSGRLDIIGFDACFMSMFEMADELKGLADYMVASQDEVPDLSFPYDNMIQLFGRPAEGTVSLLKDGVQLYVTTYQDCVCNNTTEMNPVTLSVLKLDNCGDLGDKVKSLACALLRANHDAKDEKCLQDVRLQEVLIEARKYSKDYAGGLYVDLYDFCHKLVEQLSKLKGKQEEELEELKKKQGTESEESKEKKQGELEKTETWIKGIGGACEGVKNALDISKGNSLVLQNGTVEISKNGENAKAQVNGSAITEGGQDTKAFPNEKIRNHGISIYLPYLSEDQYAEVQKPLVKGGRLTGKGFGEALHGAGIEYLMYSRRDLILDTESYYARLKLADETNWYAFITEVWTRALMEKSPADLDYHYSAQQSWMNVTRKPPVNIDELCKPEPNPNPKRSG